MLPWYFQMECGTKISRWQYPWGWGWGADVFNSTVLAFALFTSKYGELASAVARGKQVTALKAAELPGTGWNFTAKSLDFWAQLVSLFFEHLSDALFAHQPPASDTQKKEKQNSHPSPNSCIPFPENVRVPSLFAL